LGFSNKSNGGLTYWHLPISIRRMSIKQTILSMIESYLRATNMTATAFGVAVMNDTAFVHDLRRGRDMTLSVADRVIAYMRDHPAEGGPAFSDEQLVDLRGIQESHR